MIASFIDGRVRVRSAALRDEKTMNMVLSLLGEQDGITGLTPNLRTGSILVLYDPSRLSREELLQGAALLQSHFPELGAAASRAAEGARATDSLSLSSLAGRLCRGGGKISPLSPLAESTLMSAVYLLTAVSGLGNRRVHIALGTLFAALAGVHLFDRRRSL